MWSEKNSSVPVSKFKLRNLGVLIAGAIFTIIFLIFVVFSTPIYIFRVIVTHYTKWFRPDLGVILNPLSSLLANDLFSGKPPQCTIIVPMTLQGQWTREELYKFILERWIQSVDEKSGELIYERFQQYPTRQLGFTFWKHEDGKQFSLDEHIRYHENQQGEIFTSEKLNELIEQLLNAPYPPEKSPWEIHYVANYKNTQDKEAGYALEEPMFALILRIHHVLGDGFSLLSAIVEGLGGQSLDNMKLALPQSVKQTGFEKFIGSFTIPFRVFWEATYLFSRSFEKCPWKVGEDQKAWWQLYARSNLIPIEDIKHIKNSFQVSFTSVLMSAISSGIHQHLKIRKDVEPEALNQSSMLCLSTLPAPGHTRRLTNRVIAGIFDVPTTQYSNPVNRLVACDTVLKHTQKSVAPYMSSLFQTTMGCHFYSVSTALNKNRSISTGLTNFPSLPGKILIGNAMGVYVDFAVGVLEGDGGVGFMVLSYGDHIRLALVAEKAVMSREQMDEFMKYVQNEVNDLLAKAKEIKRSS